MESHICDNEDLVAQGKSVPEWKQRVKKKREKGEKNRGGIDRYEQIITRPLFQCVKSVTLQRWARQGRDQWATFC